MVAQVDIFLLRQINVCHKHLCLLHKAFMAYVSGNVEGIEDILKRGNFPEPTFVSGVERLTGKDRQPDVTAECSAEWRRKSGIFVCDFDVGMFCWYFLDLAGLWLNFCFDVSISTLRLIFIH